MKGRGGGAGDNSAGYFIGSWNVLVLEEIPRKKIHIYVVEQYSGREIT